MEIIDYRAAVLHHCLWERVVSPWMLDAQGKCSYSLRLCPWNPSPCHTWLEASAETFVVLLQASAQQRPLPPCRVSPHQRTLRGGSCQVSTKQSLQLPGWGFESLTNRPIEAKKPQVCVASRPCLGAFSSDHPPIPSITTICQQLL